MRLITEAETRSALTLDAAAELIAETYRAHGEARARASTPSLMRIAGGPVPIAAKGAVVEERDLAGLRMLSPGRSRLMLWRLSTGAPVALIDESWLYRFRTGVSVAVVARMLLPQAWRGTVALVGAGPIGWEAARAICRLLDPERLLVAARRAESAAEFARRAVSEGMPAEPADDAASAARQADLVITITSSEAAFLGPGDIRAGATVVSMGGGPEFRLGVWQEAAARFVDDLDYALSRGDAAGWIAAGEIDAAAFRASLTGTVGELALGRWAGRGAGDETVMAIVQGFAALDVALAGAVLEALGGEGRG